MTKEKQRFVDQYNWSVKHYGYRTLNDLYKNPSDYKLFAYKRIQQECEDLKGTGLTCTGGSCFAFSAAFKYTKDNKKYLRYYTSARTIDIELED